MTGGPSSPCRRPLRARRRRRSARPVVPALPWALLLAFLAAGCGDRVPPELQPDEVLRAELGLTEDDEVHRVVLTSDAHERPTPDSLAVPPGAWVEFVTGDWRVHEVRFVLDGLPAGARAFLEATDQVASPPLVDRDARFVVSFAEAPPGRYPFVVEGNGAAANGVVVVVPRP